MQSPKTHLLVVLVAVSTIVGSALAGDPRVPRTVITPVLQLGDPAPGVPNATITLLGTPQIDASGNVLFFGVFRRDGETIQRTALWFGQPGALQVIAFNGMQAPDMPVGVVYDFIWIESVSETGCLAITAAVRGPGIVAGVNDFVIFAGVPGDIRKVLGDGDQAPDLDPGTLINPIFFSQGFGASLSDNGTMFVSANLRGPLVDATNDRAMWVGPPDDLQLIWREGMVAPGTNGARFAFLGSPRFNDARQIVFLGLLVNEPGIDYTNDHGIWVGAPGTLNLLAREGEPAPGTGACFRGFNPPVLNASGDVAISALLAGVDIGPDNEGAVWVRTPDGIRLLTREGDAACQIGPGVTLASTGAGFINARREIFYRVKYAGPSIDDSNAWAMYLGPFDNPRQTLRDGDPAPHFPAGTTLGFVGAVRGLCAMNDVGDILAPTEIVGPGVTPETKLVFWIRDHVRDDWFPLLRSGDDIDGRVVSTTETGASGFPYSKMTGGSDGRPQSFNDAGQFVVNIPFVDGTDGIFVLEFSWPGDADGDADVDLRDFGSFQRCFGTSAVQDCEAFDFNEDQVVDLSDYGSFVEATTGPG